MPQALPSRCSLRAQTPEHSSGIARSIGYDDEPVELAISGERALRPRQASGQMPRSLSQTWHKRDLEARSRPPPTVGGFYGARHRARWAPRLVLG